MMMLLLTILSHACADGYIVYDSVDMIDMDVRLVLQDVSDNTGENDVEIHKIENSNDLWNTEADEDIDITITPDAENEDVNFGDSDNGKEVPNESADEANSIDANEVDADIEIIIQVIDNRVDWILERLWNDPYMRTEYTALEFFAFRNTGDYEELYYGDSIISRTGGEYCIEIEGAIVYELYYDEDGHMIFADITQYRHPAYCIYFHNDAVICIITGERTNEREKTYNEYMTNAVRLCLENAYF